MQAEKLAKLEVAAWQAYYQGDMKGTFAHVQAWFENLYQLTTDQAEQVTIAYAQAMMTFGQTSEKAGLEVYKETVLADYEKAYTELGRYFPLAQSVREVAWADLWWAIARRMPSQATPAQVGAAIADFYEGVYGDENRQAFEKAGYLRATAMQFRDMTSNLWDGTNEDDWAAITRLLTEAYGYLEIIDRIGK